MNWGGSMSGVGVPQFSKRKLIYGVGVNNYPTTTKVNGVECKSYRVWKDLLKRCYSASYKEKYQSYCDVSCDPVWLKYTEFCDNVGDMIGAFQDGYQLDKDLLGDGSFYDYKNCCFLPDEINLSLTSRPRTSDTGLPIGVRLVGSRYYARTSSNGKEVNLGYHNTAHEAFLAYKTYREKRIKFLAEKYKGVIDNRVYDALIKYVIDPDD